MWFTSQKCVQSNSKNLAGSVPQGTPKTVKHEGAPHDIARDCTRVASAQGGQQGKNHTKDRVQESGLRVDGFQFWAGALKMKSLFSVQAMYRV